MPSSDERNLIERAQKGETAAFEALVRQHRAKLRSFACHICGGNRADADDVLQESLVKAFLSLGTFRGSCSFSTWLWRIVRNEFIDLTRSPHYAADHFDPQTLEHTPAADGKSAEEELISEDRRLFIRRLVGDLPPLLREALVLVDLEQVSYDEAADILNISLTALKSRVFQARKKLAEMLTEARGIL